MITLKEGHFYIVQPVKLYISNLVLKQDEVIYISKDNNDGTVEIKCSDGTSHSVSKQGLSVCVEEFC